MKKSLFVSVLLSAALPLFAQMGVTPGSKMPEVNAQWYSSAPQASAVPQAKQLDIVIFADISAPGTDRLLRLVETLEPEFGSGAVIRVVVNNPFGDLKAMMDSAQTPYSVTIGSDIGRKTFSRFAIASTPFAYIGQDGAMTWSGHPVDLEYIASSILGGRFSRSDYARLSKFRADMQSAMRAGLPDVAAKTADKALEVAPDDMISLQMRIYAFEAKGHIADAAAFLEKHLEKHPSFKTRMLYLDIVRRSGDTAKWRKAASAAVDEAGRDPNMNHRVTLAAYLLESSPFADVPVKAIIAMMNDSLKNIEKGGATRFLADSLEISARAYYTACLIDKAAEIQAQAVGVREALASPLLRRAEHVLEFYKSLKTK